MYVHEFKKWDIDSYDMLRTNTAMNYSRRADEYEFCGHVLQSEFRSDFQFGRSVLSYFPYAALSSSWDGSSIPTGCVASWNAYSLGNDNDWTTDEGQSYTD